MQAERAGVLAALVLSLSAPASAFGPARRAASQPAAPPRLLNIVRVKLKPRAAGSYETLEAQIVRAYDRAKAKVYWVGLQSPKDPSEVLYLNLYDSQESADRAAAAYEGAVKQHPELVALQQRLAGMSASTTSTLATHRDDVDRVPPDADFNSMRRLRLTMIQVRPGREGDFLNAIRTSHSKDGSWLVYEANDSSTYALITLKRAALNRADGPAIPRGLRRLKGIYTKAETRVYTVRPAMSHMRDALPAATGTGGRR